jgi:hypothetical protein
MPKATSSAVLLRDYGTNYDIRLDISAVTQYTIVWCRVPVVGIIITKHCFVNVTPLKLVQKKHYGSKLIYIYNTMVANQKSKKNVGYPMRSQSK